MSWFLSYFCQCNNCNFQTEKSVSVNIPDPRMDVERPTLPAGWGWQFDGAAYGVALLCPECMKVVIEALEERKEGLIPA